VKIFSRALSIFLVLLLFISCKKEPGPGDPVNIPQGRFYDVLLELGVDVNGDGSISYVEAEKVFRKMCC
jgi:hypothetical protein